MPRKRSVKLTKVEAPATENFEFCDRTYQIDPGRKKVYRRFVEIETSKAAEIFSVWRASNA